MNVFSSAQATCNYMAGIYPNNVNYCNISENNASENHHGICLDSSSSNTIENNTASNFHTGIFLQFQSHYNTLMSNTANSNGCCGICLMYSRNNIITCNWVQNNTVRGFYLRYATSNNISYNNIIENGNYNTETGGWEWNFYNDQPDIVEAKHNYWGAGLNNSMIDASTYGRVKFYPFETKPVQCPLTPKPPAFTTTDAVIALQIAAGSRPPDPRWDVSGDDSFTSLDAMMILQAAGEGMKTG